MKIVIKIEKKHLYFLMAFVLIIAGLTYVLATGYSGQQSHPTLFTDLISSISGDNTIDVSSNLNVNPGYAISTNSLNSQSTTPLRINQNNPQNVEICISGANACELQVSGGLRAGNANYNPSSSRPVILGQIDSTKSSANLLELWDHLDKVFVVDNAGNIDIKGNIKLETDGVPNQGFILYVKNSGSTPQCNSGDIKLAETLYVSTPPGYGYRVLCAKYYY